MKTLHFIMEMRAYCKEHRKAWRPLHLLAWCMTTASEARSEELAIRSFMVLDIHPVKGQLYWLRSVLYRRLSNLLN